MLPQRKNLHWLPSLLGEFIGNDYKQPDRAPVNIIDTEKSFIVEIAAPGMKKENVEIDLTNDNQLKIKIEKKSCQQDPAVEGQNQYLRKEFCCFNFEQTLILPDNIDKDAISAKQEDGIIKIDIPKKTPDDDALLHRKIEIG